MIVSAGIGNRQQHKGTADEKRIGVFFRVGRLLFIGNPEILSLSDNLSFERTQFNGRGDDRHHEQDHCRPAYWLHTSLDQP